VRVLDRLSRRSFVDGWDGWGGMGPASGASVLTTTYGTPGNEPILPQLMSSSMQAYGGNAIVFGAILARLSLFSEASFAFRDLTDKHLFGANELDGRRLTALRKLEAPWPNGTTGELLARMIQDVDLAGNAYIWDAGDQLVRLRPDWVTIISELVTDPSGRVYRKVVGYFYKPPQSVSDQGPAQMFDVEEIAHWSPIPDPWANFRGMSWITPVMREIAADNAMTGYKIKYLDNAASPNLLIKYTQKLQQATVDTIQKRVQARHGGVDNAFRTMVLDEGADVTVIGNTFEQMSFATVQAAGENRILIASGVPGIVIGAKEGLMAATYSNYEQAMRRFADITMRPLWRSACACLSKLVAVPTGARLWFDVSDIAALRQGEKEMADTMLVKMLAIGEGVKFGFDPDSVREAINAGDIGQLKHNGPPELIMQEIPKAAPPALKLPEPPGDPAAAAPGAPMPAMNGKAGRTEIFEFTAPAAPEPIVIPAPVVHVAPAQVTVERPRVRRTVERDEHGDITGVLEEVVG
jgi:phage portal protein BeeE